MTASAADSRPALAPRRRVRRPALRVLAIAVALVAMALLVSPVSAQEGDSLEDLRSRVVEAHDLVSGATMQVETSSEAASVAQRVAELLPGAERVEVDGRVVEVDESTALALAAKLEAAGSAQERREAAEALAEHLGSMRSALGVPGEAVREDPVALSELLTGREVAGGDLIQRIIQRVIEWLNSLFEGVSLEESEGGALVVKIVLWTLGVALVALVGWLILRAIRARRARDELPEDESDAPQPVVAAAEGLPDDPRAYAAVLAEQGLFRDAVRTLFGGAAREVVRRGLVRQTRTLTNRELLSSVRQASPGVHAPLGALAGAFDLAWYGHVDPERAGFDSAVAAYDAVIHSAGVPPTLAGGEAS